MQKSVSELPDFPFDSFEEFREACREGRALVWVRYDFRAVWKISCPVDRACQVLLTGSALVASILFCCAAFVRHDSWLLWGVPAALLGSLFSSPSPGIISGGGCVAIPLFAAGFFGATFVNRSLLWAGLAGVVCWFLASAGKGVADPTIREAMVKSEETFLWLYGRRVITKVAAVEEKTESGIPETRNPGAS
jgi:hypothetical protein